MRFTQALARPLSWLWLCSLLCWASLAFAATPAEPLEPAKAFTLSAEAEGDERVVVKAQIAEGYYLYRQRFSFAVDAAGPQLATARFPSGERKHDEFFGEVEIYRGDLRIEIPVTAGAASTLKTIAVSLQGCADLGVCYPPETRTLRLGEGSSGGGGFSSLRAMFGNTATAPLSQAATPAAAKETAAAPPAAAAPSGLFEVLQQSSFAVSLLAAFGAGLLLAFTPCMLPMLPILTSIVVGAANASRRRALVLATAYVLGMALTYALAGVAAALSGSLLTAALQNVWVLGGFAAIFVLLALAMFGVYELQLPAGLQATLSGAANRWRGAGLLGVVLMGALSALIIGPCVAAPLAGALLYIARTGDVWLGGSALFCMALGMGTPLLLVAGATHSVLPRAGAWMETVRKSFGVMLLGVALWLLTPVLPVFALLLGWATLLMLSGVAMHALDPLEARATTPRRLWKGLGVMMLAVGLMMLAGALGGARDPLQPLGFLSAKAGDDQALHFEAIGSVAELERHLAAGKPVMLDFYADWCVSCREMERFTFTDAGVQQALAGTVLLRADVTANSAEQRALLQRFGLFGPPGILFFDAQGQERAAQRMIGFVNAADFVRRIAAQR